MAIQRLDESGSHLSVDATPTKSIQVRVAGTGVSHDLVITPETTPAELLQAVDLPAEGANAYGLSTGQGAGMLPLHEDVYPRVKDGDILWASLPVDVGR